MRNILYRFTVLALVPAIVLADPAWASGIARTFDSPSPIQSQARDLWTTQALSARLLAPTTGIGLKEHWKTAVVLPLTLLIAMSSVFGQEPAPSGTQEPSNIVQTQNDK